MKDAIIFNDKKYLSSKNAGRVSGYTSDYVSRLCRLKKIEGRKVGRTWYVEESSLENFLHNNSLQKSEQSKKLSNQRIRDYRKSIRQDEISVNANNLKSKVQEFYKIEIVKKSFAVLLATTIVLGGFFLKDTNVAKSAYEKASYVATKSLNTANVVSNIFTKPAESISSVFTLENEAVYVYLTTNKIICGIIPVFNVCPTETEKDTIVVEEVVEEKKEELVFRDLETRKKEEPIAQKIEPTPEPIVKREPVVVSQPIVNQQVTERIIETQRVVTVGGVSREEMNLAMEQLKNKIYSDMSNLTAANETKIVNNYQTIAATNKIDDLGNVTIHDSSITDTIITNSSFQGTTGAFSQSLYSAGGVSTNKLLLSSGVPLDTTNTLYNDAGNLYWNGLPFGTGGGGGGSWTDLIGLSYNSTTTNQILIGASATTTTAKLEVIGGGYFSGNLVCRNHIICSTSFNRRYKRNQFHNINFNIFFNRWY